MKEKILQLAKKGFKHELINGSFYLLLGSTFASFLAFLFNFAIIRLITPTQYGIIATLISLITLLTIPTQSFTTIIIQFATRFFSLQQIPHAATFYKSSLKNLTVGAILFAIVFLTLSPIISSFLHIDNILLIILTDITISLSYICIVNTAYLQSLLKFKTLGWVLILGAAVKLFIGVAALPLGFGLIGIMIGIMCLPAVSLFSSFIPLKFLLSTKTKHITLPKTDVISYSISTAIAIFALSSFTTSDIILVKHFFPALQAGQYAGLALVGRVIFYFTLPIGSVMFPVLIQKHTKGEEFHSTFLVALLLVAIPSIAITLFYLFFPTMSVLLFLGGKQYLAISPYLVFFGLCSTLLSISNICTIFFLSIKKTNISWVILLCALLQIVGITYLHQTIIQVLFVSLILLIVLTLILLLYYAQEYATKK